MTLTLNIWPYTPWKVDRFDPMQLLAHAIGPLVAIGAVTVLPIIWSAFAGLDHEPIPIGPTPQEYRQNASDDNASPGRATNVRTALLVKRAQQLITIGQLPVDPSATRLREILGCGTNTAREVRDALRTKDVA